MGLSMLFVGNAVGVYNIMTHQGTTKNAWNLDMKKNLKLLDENARQHTKTFYFTHHPSYVYHLNVKNRDVVSFYNSLYFDSLTVRTDKTQTSQMSHYPFDMVFIVNYRGQSISPEHYAELMDGMKAIKADSVKHFYLDKDASYTLKRKYFSDYPAYATEIIWYYGVRDHGNKLGAWERNK